MANKYDDTKYGVITRKWFGLTQKNGGDAAAGFTFGTGDAGPDSVKVTRFYPKAPCDIIKFGALFMATAGHGATNVERCITRLIGRGASASKMASFNLLGAASTTVAPYTIASIEAADTTDFLVTQVKAGEYISVMVATKETSEGTDLGSTLGGTVAYFVDIVPRFDSDKWDADPKKYQA
jgi:hypothetical protein